MSSTITPPLRMAVLDDYHSIAHPILSPLTSTHNITISYYPTTLHPLHSNSDAAKLIERLKPYAIISTMRERTPLPSSILSNLPNLKLLLTTGTRNAAIDTNYLAENGIIYCGTGIPPDTSSEKAQTPTNHSATNEHTFALILSLAKNIIPDHINVQNGGWANDLVFGLAGKTLALLGFGRLGIQAAVTGMLGFGMKVICWSEHLTQEKADAESDRRGLGSGVWKVVRSKRELFEEADVLSVHYVLSERSRGIVGVEELGAMKPNSLFINTSRAGLVDTSALLKLLKEGKIRGAALDVFDREPLEEDSEWRTIKWGEGERGKVVLSPHMGYAEEEIMRGWYEMQRERVGEWVEGREVKGRIVP